MMTSSNGNIFRVSGLLCREFTGPRWIPLTKASDAELRCFLWSVPWINGWVSNHEAGDLRRHRGLYDVTEMTGINAYSYCVPVKDYAGRDMPFYTFVSTKTQLTNIEFCPNQKLLITGKW